MIDRRLKLSRAIHLHGDSEREPAVRVQLACRTTAKTADLATKLAADLGDELEAEEAWLRPQGHGSCIRSRRAKT